MADLDPTEIEDPELEDVRGWYIDGRRVHNPFASDVALVERFDRWLARRDAEMKAAAWSEAIDEMTSQLVSMVGEDGTIDQRMALIVAQRLARQVGAARYREEGR